MSGVFSALLVLLVLAATGGAIQLSLARPGTGIACVAFESMAIGLFVQELIGLFALRSGHYSRATVLVLTLVVIAGAVLVWFFRRSARTERTASHLSAENRRLGLLVLGGLVVVLGVAIVVRQGPSYFIFETGDMGEYVNGANVLASVGKLSASFPHGFTVFLGGTNLLLGRAHTVAGLPALGVLLVLGAFAYTRAVGLHLVAGLGIAALVAVHPVTVWFSLFPVSESLYAVLLIAALYFLAQARARRSYSAAVLAGLIVGLMLLVRGNALLLAPISVLGLFASAATDDEDTVRVQRRFTVVALIALSAAYAYDVHYPQHYFVQNQLRGMLPHSVFKVADKARLFDFSAPLVIAAALGLVVVLYATVLVTRFVRPRVVERPVVFWRFAYGILVGFTLVALVLMHHGGLVDALLRWGPVLLVLTAVGLAAVLIRPGRYVDGVNGWILLLVTCSYSLLFASRVKVSMPHAYYLYYDRYLFSEVLPAAIVFAAIALHFFVDAFIAAPRLDATKARAMRVALVVLAVVAAVAFVPNLKETHRITRFPLFGDSYQTLSRLDRLTRTDGDGAVVYSAPPTVPPGWFFQNTYRAFALPLGETFRRTVLGMPSNPFGKDPHFDAQDALAKLKKSGFDPGYLISLRAPGATFLENDPHAHYIGTVDYASPLLHRSAKRGPTPWVLVPFRFDVYEVS